jgi:phosphoribosylcarboxyaminoimidazole (NCAIR) mutase
MLTRLKEEVAKAQRNEERMWDMMLQRNKEQQAAVKAIVDGAGAMTELCESCASVDAERLG